MSENVSSVKRACRVLSLCRSVYYYECKLDSEEEIAESLKQMHKKHPSSGFYQLYHRLRGKGKRWGKARTLRVYNSLGLSMKRRKTKKKIRRPKQPMEKLESTNQVWCMDFVHDQLGNGQAFRTLNILDEFSRESLCIYSDRSIGGKQVIRQLEELIDFRGKPKAIRTDNGSEFISEDVAKWSKKNGIDWLYIQPGHPTQNPYVERFNGTLRQELYNLHIFKNLKQVREMNQEWMDDYNNFRPHKGIGYRTPIQMARSAEKSLITNCPN